MNADNNELLMRVIFSVFEDFAFMFAEETSEFDDEEPGDCLMAKIDFESRKNKGYMEIIAPLDFCHETAENILGADAEELPEDAGENALKELVNISCGYFLAERFGTEETFDLSIPETEMISEKQWLAFADKKRHALFLVDETPVMARVVI